MEYDLMFVPTETVTVTIEGEDYVVTLDEVKKNDPQLYHTIVYYDNARRDAALLQYETRKLNAALVAMKQQVLVGTNNYVVKKYKLEEPTGEESSEQGDEDE